ncbi:hypothetical protein BD410DRAFT_780977 [Rickenella mellea]|uniref:Transmembrane protein n=1 Tax=Rickenella mellea TaxID=50990 RepID=A0A4Y7QNL3_9AGAM|nr:hypothetical protein BD410DRAFT_780977 [Rickenella mellea]
MGPGIRGVITPVIVAVCYVGFMGSVYYFCRKTEGQEEADVEGARSVEQVLTRRAANIEPPPDVHIHQSVAIEQRLTDPRPFPTALTRAPSYTSVYNQNLPPYSHKCDLPLNVNV